MIESIITSEKKARMTSIDNISEPLSTTASHEIHREIISKNARDIIYFQIVMTGLLVLFASDVIVVPNLGRLLPVPFHISVFGIVMAITVVTLLSPVFVLQEQYRAHLGWKKNLMVIGIELALISTWYIA